MQSTMNVYGAGTGAQVLQRIEDALKTLQSNYHGASLPTTELVAGMEVTLSDGTIWRRNAANSDWVAAGSINLALADFVQAMIAARVTNPKVLPVNGCCMVDQVNAGALITPANGSYPIDNLYFIASVASKLQAQQITTSLLTLNASHAIRYSVLAQYVAAASEAFHTRFAIEGADIVGWRWGTANATAVSLQFKARASVAGTYSGALRNASANRSYPFSYTLAANEDTLVKIENIPGETTGTWFTGATGALQIHFDLGSGANVKGAAGAWAAANYIGATGADAFVAQANGSTLDITDVFINEGSFCREFPRQNDDDVLRACQRYLPVFAAGSASAHQVGGGANAPDSTHAYTTYRFPVTPMVAPTGLTVSNAAHFSVGCAGVTSDIACTNIALSASGTQDALLYSTVAAGLTAGQVITMRSYSASAKLIFTGSQI